jgi:acetoacetate decarboxylase
MNIAEILTTSSMPIASPTYPKGPYRFINRQYMIVTYESDPEAIRAAVPEPLEPDGSNTVLYEFIRMPDSTGFGDYTETGIVIPCTYRGEAVNFTAQMYLYCEPPISGGREIWGFPKKLADVSLKVNRDTLAGRLEYAGQPVALASMAYKHENLVCGNGGHDHSGATCDAEPLRKKLSKTQVNLKLIPDVDAVAAHQVLVLVGHARQGHRLAGVLQAAGQGVAIDLEGDVGQLLGEAPDLPAAGNGRFAVEVHLGGEIDRLAPIGAGDHDAGLGVVAEAGGIGHADEFVEHGVAAVRFQGLGNRRADGLGIGLVGDDHVLAVDEAVRPLGIGRAGDGHRGGGEDFGDVHGNFSSRESVWVRGKLRGYRCSSGCRWRRNSPAATVRPARAPGRAIGRESPSRH